MVKCLVSMSQLRMTWVLDNLPSALIFHIDMGGALMVFSSGWTGQNMQCTATTTAVSKRGRSLGSASPTVMKSSI